MARKPKYNPSNFMSRLELVMAMTGSLGIRKKKSKKRRY